MEKIKLSVLIRELENDIKSKDDGLNSQSIDKEILAIISIYRHGRKDYKNTVTKWLTVFLANAGYVKGVRSIEVD